MNPVHDSGPLNPRLRRSGRRWQAFFALSFLSALAAPSPLWACAACFGRSDDAMARGMNMAILSLLVFVVFVLSGLAAFAIFLARRAARFGPPAATVAREDSSDALADTLSQPITK